MTDPILARNIFRFGIGMLVTMAVVLGAIGWAWTQDGDGFDGSAVAVAVIDTQMELTRRQVIFYGVDDAKQACAAAAWRPAMHHAVHILEADDTYAPRVDRWVDSWGEGLVLCYRGDMANAATGIAEAFKWKDSMMATATSGER